MTNWNGVDGVTWDAFFSHPTNDWRLASLLAALFSTNAPRNLHSVNQTQCPRLERRSRRHRRPHQHAPGQLDSVIMRSNSPQALTIAGALNALRSSQPGGSFHGVGDILSHARTEHRLALVRPGRLAIRTCSPVTDAAFEAIPAQTARAVAAGFVRLVRQTGGGLQVQFTGSDGFAYNVQASSNLLDWTTISTNYPTNGVFAFPGESRPADSSRWFYRSVLGP